MHHHTTNMKTTGKFQSVFIIAITTLALLLTACKKDPELTLARATLPTVTDITATSAKIEFSVTHQGGGPVSECGICWSTSVNPDLEDNTIILGQGLGTYTFTITQLDTNTTYYVRSYVINTVGLGFSGNSIFITDTI